ncbi:hypothetical protein BLOT_013803 [Blomia tropicalis]|nr:hypothetical protein BLOT_013803 [Blomia tropicalis]
MEWNGTKEKPVLPQYYYFKYPPEKQGSHQEKDEEEDEEKVEVERVLSKLTTLSSFKHLLPFNDDSTHSCLDIDRSMQTGSLIKK